MRGIVRALKKRGLASRDVVAEKIMSWPAGRVLDAALDLFENLDSKDDLQTDNLAPFNFIPSSELSGLSGCREWGCRARRSQLLARYAALYADSIVVPWQLSLPNSFRASEDFRYELTGAILAVLEMRPLIEAGIIRLVHPSFHFCSDCAATGLQMVKSIRDATRRTRIAHEDRFLARVEKPHSPGSRLFSLNGPEEFLEHGSILIEFDRAPSWAKGVRGRLPKEVLSKSGFVDDVFEKIAGDLIFHQLCTQSYDAKLLTSLPGEAEILRRLNRQDEQTSALLSLCARLTHEIPLMSNVPLERVLKIRNEEPTAFLQYRTALAGIVKEYIQPRKALSKIEAKQIYEDRLLPELAQLRRGVEVHRAKMLKKSAATAAVVMAIVTLGMTAGLHAPDFAATGTGALMGGLAALLGDAGPEPDAVKNHQLYFLLKLSEGRRR